MNLFTTRFAQIRLGNHPLGFPVGFQNMKIKITTRAVDALTIKAKVYEVYDNILTGLLVRVLPSGLKSFWIPYRLLNGKRDRMVIGPWGYFSCSSKR